MNDELSLLARRYNVSAEELNKLLSEHFKKKAEDEEEMESAEALLAAERQHTVQLTRELNETQKRLTDHVATYEAKLLAMEKRYSMLQSKSDRQKSTYEDRILNMERMLDENQAQLQSATAKIKENLDAEMRYLNMKNKNDKLVDDLRKAEAKIMELEKNTLNSNDERMNMLNRVISARSNMESKAATIARLAEEIARECGELPTEEHNVEDGATEVQQIAEPTLNSPPPAEASAAAQQPKISQAPPLSAPPPTPTPATPTASTADKSFWQRVASFF